MRASCARTAGSARIRCASSSSRRSVGAISGACRSARLNVGRRALQRSPPCDAIAACQRAAAQLVSVLQRSPPCCNCSLSACCSAASQRVAAQPAVLQLQPVSVLQRSPPCRSATCQRVATQPAVWQQGTRYERVASPVPRPPVASRRRIPTSHHCAAPARRSAKNRSSRRPLHASPFPTRADPPMNSTGRSAAGGSDEAARRGGAPRRRRRRRRSAATSSSRSSPAYSSSPPPRRRPPPPRNRRISSRAPRRTRRSPRPSSPSPPARVARAAGRARTRRRDTGTSPAAARAPLVLTSSMSAPARPSAPAPLAACCSNCCPKTGRARRGNVRSANAPNVHEVYALIAVEFATFIVSY